RPRRTLPVQLSIGPFRSREFVPARDRPAPSALKNGGIFLRLKRNLMKPSEASPAPTRLHNHSARLRLCDWQPERPRGAVRPSTRLQQQRDPFSGNRQNLWRSELRARRTVLAAFLQDLFGPR